MTGNAFTDFGALANQIAAWLRAHAGQAGATHLVLGLSGGIDSAVACALAARAVGASKVIAAILPIDSLDDDVRDAEVIARALDVRPLHIDLTPTYETLLAALPEASPAAEPALQALALANTKPRLRMTTLYYLAQVHRGLVIGTGNRTEIRIGYFTKYGDGGVDLLPLGDLNKTEIRALALELGVPAAIIAKAPSAGLWPGQTDEAEIGMSYDQLERALLSLDCPAPGDTELAARDRVGALVAASEHKRRPIPVFRRRDAADWQHAGI